MTQKCGENYHKRIAKPRVKVMIQHAHFMTQPSLAIWRIFWRCFEKNDRIPHGNSSARNEYGITHGRQTSQKGKEKGNSSTCNNCDEN